MLIIENIDYLIFKYDKLFIVQKYIETRNCMKQSKNMNLYTHLFK